MDSSPLYLDADPAIKLLLILGKICSDVRYLSLVFCGPEYLNGIRDPNPLYLDADSNVHGRVGLDGYTWGNEARADNIISRTEHGVSGQLSA